MYDSCR